MATVRDLRSVFFDAEIVYPDSDGKPMAENTLQYQWITTIKGNLDGMYADRTDVFIAGDLFWYPVRGEPEIVRAPDVLVAFGRPKAHRLSYKLWIEDNRPPQVIFEILSQSNRAADVTDMHDFYETYGVDEFYVYDPQNRALRGFLRQNGALVAIPEMNGWVSPLLQIRFEMNGELVLYRPSGERFLTFEELSIAFDVERQRADQERQRAEQERQRAEQEQKRAEQSQTENLRLRDLLRQQGIDPDQPR